MDLIDRDGLRKALGINNPDCDKCSWGGVHGRCVRGSDFEDACVAIDDAPSVELDNNSTEADSRNDELIRRQVAIDVMSCINDSVREQWAIEALEKLPPAEPEIIYCKDCDQYNPEAQFCDLLQFNFLPEGHCSWGRRKKRAL